MGLGRSLSFRVSTMGMRTHFRKSVKAEYKKTGRPLTAAPGTEQGPGGVPVLHSRFSDSIKRYFPEAAGSLPEDDMSFLGHLEDAPHLITSLF